MPSGMGGRSPLFGDSEIISAAIKIQGDGGEVTAYTLMNRLGGGSIPYFKKAIKRLIRDKQIQTQAIIGEYDDVIETITGLFDRMRDESRLKAHNDYKADRAQYESANAGLREELAINKAEKTNFQETLSSLQAELKKANAALELAKAESEGLRLDLTASNERLSNLTQALEKEEAKGALMLDRLHEAHNQFQGERRELLDRINEISLSTRTDLEGARQAEQSMRAQLNMALKDGIEHTTTISKLRDENRKLEGGKQLLKRYGTWQKISALCATSNKSSSRK